MAPGRGAIALLAALSAGCAAADEAVSEAHPAVRTVRRSPRELQSVPQWHTTVLHSTADHDSLRLWSLTSAAFAPDSSLVIGGGPELLSLSSDGRAVQRLGREGNGPGEYRTILRVLPAEDGTFLVADLGGRLTHIQADGSVIRIVPRLESGGEGRETDVLALLPDGRIVATWWQQRPNRGGLAGLRAGAFERDPVPLLVFDTAGQRTDSLGTWAGLERAVVSLNGGTSRIPPAFARSTLHDARGRAVAIGPADSVDVTLFDGGRPVLRLLVSGERETPSPELMAAWRRGVGGELGDAGELVIRVLEGGPRVRELPRIGALVVDDERNLWVGGYAPPGANERQWTIFSSAGEPIGRISLPAMVEALVPGRSEILDVHRGRLALRREVGSGEFAVEVRRIHRP
jgi:hypothetical protein